MSIQGQSFELVWDTSNQIYNDVETFVVIQGDDASGETVCSVSNPSAGLQSSCGSNGAHYLSVDLTTTTQTCVQCTEDLRLENLEIQVVLEVHSKVHHRSQVF